MTSSNIKQAQVGTPFKISNPTLQPSVPSISIPQKPEPATKPAQEAFPPPESIVQQSKRSAALPDTQNSLPNPESTLRPSVLSVENHPSMPLRPEIARHVSESPIYSRPLHSLPNRPEASNPRVNDNRVSDRLPDRAPREVRDPHQSGSNRNERLNEVPRERGEHYSTTPRRRSQERQIERSQFNERTYDRSNEKGLPARPSTDDKYPDQIVPDNRPLTRETRSDRVARDRPYSDSLGNSHQADSQGRSSRDPSMAPPRSSVPHHPDRTSLITGSQDQHTPLYSDRRADSIRHDNHPDSQRGSRNTSPSRRDDSRSNRHDGLRDRDDRLSLENRRFPEEGTRTHASRADESHPPTGPRTDRQGEPSHSIAGDRFRETLRGQPSNNPPPADLSHGRLSQDYDGSHRSESQYGRLTSGPEIPSGPRLANGSYAPTVRNSGRNVSAPQPHINTQQPPASQSSLPSPTIPSRGAPTGPSSSRAAPRDVGQHNRPPSAPSSAPVTPSTESSTVAGIHPDRLKAIQGPGVSAPLNTVTVPSSSNHATNHPLPSPISVTIHGVQRGSHGTQPPSPLGPSRQGPPTGPSFGNERNRGDKRFAGIQNVLQQAGTPNLDRSYSGTTIRGRGGRANNPVNHSSSSPITTGPPTPSIGRQQDSFPQRADLFTGTGRSNTQGPEDPIYGRDTRRDRPRDDAERRPTHRRNSRSPDHDHQPSILQQSLSSTSIRPEDDRSFRHPDHRQRDHIIAGRANNSSAAHTNGTDIRASQQQQPPGPVLSSAPVNAVSVLSTRRNIRDSDKDRDRRSEVERRDFSGHGDWERERERRGDPRRDERDRDRRDGGRKRRGEDGMVAELGQGDRGYGMDGKRRRNG